jgi:predicted ATPase
METARLVTLTGPGGIGKTRLALECARRLEQDGRAVRLAELAPVTDGKRLPDALLTALGRGESILARHREDPVERLTAAVRHRETVLVVDNCEHLVDDVALLLSRCLARAPRLRVLATSREALGIFGEAVHAVGPLPPAETLRLFSERAAASDPAFALTDENTPVVERICAALDGLPLAIELAAARLRSMSLDDLAARLGDRFAVLNRGDRTAAPRQRSLRGVVDWSWELLDAAERRLLARMSVFNGGFDLAAAEAVCGADVDAVADLVDKSLVQRLPEGRYRLLETVRDYAAERLDEFGETAGRNAAHADCYAARCETASPHLMRAEQVEWLERLALDHGNITAAIRRMVAAGDAVRAHRGIRSLGWYWWMRGHRVEGQALVEEVRSMEGEVPPRDEAMIGLAATWGLWSGMVDPAEAVAGFEAAHGLVERYDLTREEPLLKMVEVLLALVHDDEARLRQVLEDTDPEADAWVHGMALLFCSEYSYRAGRAEQGLAEITECNAVFEALGERFGIIMSLQGLAAARTEEGDHKEARRLVARALRTEAELGASPYDSVIVEHLWRLDAEHADDPEAVLDQMRRETAALEAEPAGNENLVAARVAAAICLRRLGRLDEARDELLLAETSRPRFVQFSEVSVRLYQQLQQVAVDLGDRGLEDRVAEILDQIPPSPLNW